MDNSYRQCNDQEVEQDEGARRAGVTWDQLAPVPGRGHYAVHRCATLLAAAAARARVQQARRAWDLALGRVS